MKSRLNKNSWVLTTPVAHRGLHNGQFGENSMGAYKNAIENGYPIEMDVQLSSDGVLFCFHDDNLLRVTGKNAFINDLTSEQIKQLKILNTNEGIPTFEEFLKEVNGKVPLMIEIKRQKSKQYDIAKLVLNALDNYKGEYVLQSFDPLIMGKVKKYAPHVLRGQLGGIDKRGDLPFIQYVIVRYLLLNFYTKPDYVNYMLEIMPAKTSRPQICWTVRDEKGLKKAKDLKVNYVFEKVNPKG